MKEVAVNFQYEFNSLMPLFNTRFMYINVFSALGAVTKDKGDLFSRIFKLIYCKYSFPRKHELLLRLLSTSNQTICRNLVFMVLFQFCKVNASNSRRRIEVLKLPYDCTTANINNTKYSLHKTVQMDSQIYLGKVVIEIHSFTVPSNLL